MTRRLFIALLSVLLALLSSQLIFLQLEGHAVASLAVQAASASHVFADWMAAVTLMSLLLSGRGLLRIPAYLLLCLLVLLYAAQIASLWLTGDFIGPTALVNASHIGLVMSPARIATVAALGILLLAVIVFAERKCRSREFVYGLALAVACMGLAAALRSDEQWLDAEIVKQRARLFQTGYNGLGLASPLQVFWQSAQTVRRAGEQDVQLDDAEIATLAEFGIHYDRLADYPLVKNDIYNSRLPFAPAMDSGAPDTKLNLIVFFSEGLSARVIQPYSDAYPDLTPNIAAFAESTMRVDNYYNHTFATYRGLLGQLCSIFPVYAGGRFNPDTDYYCLADLLGDEGYRSHFLFSQQRARTKLDEVLGKANVDHVFAQEDLQRLYLQGVQAGRPLALSDQQFFDAFIAHLQSLEGQQASGGGTPFVLGLYNIETHAYYHASDDGVSYAGHDSYILDSIRNFDDAFGRFWSYFKSSGLYSNTIVVFTADHAHFQGKDFVALVDGQPDYQHMFVDRIPLIIYHPVMQLPASFDAKYASSIDLAPSIAHLMQLDNRANAFIGRSIFERAGDESLAWGEGNVYLIGPGGIQNQGRYIEALSGDARLNRLHKGLSALNALEINGRIWNGQRHGQPPDS
jgi:phosphoglycerol transferase MdoB-like AlkP superfamily enzyme